MQQLASHLHLLHPYARNLVEILRVAGLRAEDALHLREDCLDWDASGDPRLRWHNHKLRRDGRPLPVTNEVAQAIERQRELVRDVTDHFGGRYLFRTEYGLYKFDSLCHQLNALANKVPLLGSDGEVYRIRPHAFRHTVGTQMINSGMNFIDVMTYLDHTSPSMTLSYAQIYDETLKNKFKAMVQSGQGRRVEASLKKKVGRCTPTISTIRLVAWSRSSQSWSCRLMSEKGIGAASHRSEKEHSSHCAVGYGEE